jgi:tectonin-like protein/papain like protease
MDKRTTTALRLMALALLGLTSGCAVSAPDPPGGHASGTASAMVGRHSSQGFIPNKQAPPAPRVTYSGQLPAQADLSAFNPPVGDQDVESGTGGLIGDNSCTSWATGYYLRGWYARRDGYLPSGGFAPMYLYAQIARGVDDGSKFPENFDIQKQQGIDSSGDYLHGSQDFTSQPTDAERTNAARYKITDYADFSRQGDITGGNLFADWIKITLASGNPVVIGFPLYAEFVNAKANSSFVTTPKDANTFQGQHAIFAYGYDGRGVLVENSWGTGWGNNGFGELSWDFVKGYATEVASITPQSPPPSWQQLPGTATDISVDAHGDVWAIGATPVYGGFNILHWNPGSWTWDTVSGGAARIAVGADGAPWVVNSFGDIFHWNGSWRQYPGLARDIGVGSDGSVWIAGKSSVLSDKNSASLASAQANLTTPPGPSLDPNDGGIYRWTDHGWQQVTGGANRITVYGIYPWLVSSSGAIIQRWGIDLLERPLPGSATDISCADISTRVCWIAGGGQSATSSNPIVSSWNGASWEVVPTPGPAGGKAVAVAVGPAGNGWVVDSSGRVFELPEWNDFL